MKKTKKVKAWAVVDIKYPYLYYSTTHRTIALSWCRGNAVGPDGKLLPDIKVVPCTITYEI